MTSALTKSFSVRDVTQLVGTVRYMSQKIRVASHHLFDTCLRLSVISSRVQVLITCMNTG